MAESPATEPQLFGALQNAHAAGDTEAAQRIAQMIQTQRLTAESINQKYKPSGPVGTALNEFASSATFGGTKYISALVRSYAHNKPYHEALSEIGNENEADYQENPKASWLGFGAGLLTGAGALNLAGKGLKAVGATDALNPFVFEKGAKAINAAKMAVVGGGISATEAAIEGKDVGEAAVIGGAASAVAGGVGAKIGEKIGDRVAPYVEKAGKFLGLPGYEATAEAINGRFSSPAWKRMADLLGTDVKELKDAALTFKQQSGRDPTLADIVPFTREGKLHELAQRAPTVGNAMREQEIAYSLRNPKTLRDTIGKVNGGAVATEEELAMARKTNMDTSMDSMRSTPVPLAQEQVELLNDNVLRAANKRNKPLMDRLDVAMREAEAGGNTSVLTIGDIETLRQTASSLHGSAKTASEAQYFKGLKNDITDMGGSVNPAYREALSQYNKDSMKLEGFKHGKKLQDRSTVDDAFEASRLRSEAGTEGYRSGLLSGLHERAGEGSNGALGVAKKLTTDLNLQNSLSEVLAPAEAQQLAAHSKHILSSAERRAATTPRSIQEQQGPGAGELGHAVGAIGSSIMHSVGSSVYHMTRVVSRLQLPISEGVQQKIVKYLSDPKMVKQGLNILERAGATREQIKSIARAVGMTQAGPKVGMIAASESE